MSDQYTESSSQSWFSRLGGAIKGILFGLVLLLAGIVLLFWNEGRAVKTYQALVESQQTVISVNAQDFQASNNGKLIHLSGQAETDETLLDPVFQVGAQALKLRRIVQTYQWLEKKNSETKKKLGGGTETTTTYRYSKAWRDGLLNSQQFKRPEGHQNPASVTYRSQNWVARNIHIGQYLLGSVLKNQVSNYQDYAIADLAPATNNIRRDGDQYYIGNDPKNPQVGDQLVGYQFIPAQNYSVAARLDGKTLTAHITTNGRTIALLLPGLVSAKAMFEQAKADNASLTWILRVVGTLMLLLGFVLITRPLSVVADILPFVGNLIEMGTGVIALLLSLAIASLTIGIAWISYRPLIGGSLLVIVLALIWFFRKRHTQVRQRTSGKNTSGAMNTPSAPPPPPPFK